MPQSSQSVNPWLISYITQHQYSQSRYEIDRYLLEAGYSPKDIELAWEIMKQPSSSDISNEQGLRKNRIWALIGAAIFLIQTILLFIQGSISFSSSGTWGFFLVPIFLILGLAKPPYPRILNLALLILSGLFFLVIFAQLTYFILRK